MFLCFAICFASMFTFFCSCFSSIMCCISTFWWFLRWISCLINFIFSFFALNGFLNLEYSNAYTEKSIFPQLVTLCAPALIASMLSFVNMNRLCDAQVYIYNHGYAWLILQRYHRVHEIKRRQMNHTTKYLRRRIWKATFICLMTN